MLSSAESAERFDRALEVIERSSLSKSFYSSLFDAAMATPQGCHTAARFLSARGMDYLGKVADPADRAIVEEAQKALLDHMAAEYGYDRDVLDVLYGRSVEAVVYYQGHIISGVPAGDDPEFSCLCNIFDVNPDAGTLEPADNPAWTYTLTFADALDKCVGGNGDNMPDIKSVHLLSNRSDDFELDVEQLASAVGMPKDALFKLCHGLLVQEHDQVSSVDEVYSLLGEQAAEELFREACAKCYIRDGKIEYYWDYRDTTPFTPEIIKRWLHEQTERCGYTYPYVSFPILEENRALGYKGSAADFLEGELVQLVWERTHEACIDWETGAYSMLRNAYEMIAKEKLSELAGTDIDVDIDLMDFMELCDDHEIEVDYDLDRWLREDMCFDLRLAEGAEYNTEFNSNTVLRESILRPDMDYDVEEEMKSSALLWVAEAQGVPRSEVLAPKTAEAARFHDALMEDYHGDELLVCFHATLKDYIGLIANYAEGGDFQIVGTPKTLLFDSSNGGGADYRDLVGEGLVIPSSLIADIVLDGGCSRDDALDHMVGMVSTGYTIHMVYGTTNERWSHGTVRPCPRRTLKVAVNTLSAAKEAQRKHTKAETYKQAFRL